MFLKKEFPFFDSKELNLIIFIYYGKYNYYEINSN